MVLFNSLENSFYSFFVRRYLEPFSVRELVYEFRSNGAKVSAEEIEELLEDDPNILPLEKKMYLTRAGAFTGRYFSIVPSAEEVRQGVLVPGDRCVPFVDGEQLSCFLTFAFDGTALPQKKFETDCNSVRDFFTLFGDEFANQYIASDPANATLHIEENGFELPPRLFLTGFDVSALFSRFDFRVGDRLIAFVRDWDLGVVEIYPLKHFFQEKKENVHFSDYELARSSWYQTLENALLESFDRLGPCASIDEQLANVFYENRAKLCVPLSGSIGEFLNRSTRVGLELFGVETRLWRAGETVPAEVCGSFDDLIFPFYDLPESVIESFIKDEFFSRHSSSGQKATLSDEEALARILPDFIDFTDDEYNFFSLQIKHINAKLRKSYNWFADFAYGDFRHQSLKVYEKVRELFFELDCSDDEFRKMPQTELITLSQLFSHLTNMIESIADLCGEENIVSKDDDLETMRLSLEGMEFNFEDIRPILLDAYEKIARARFTVVN